MENNFRLAAIDRDGAGDADALVEVALLGVADLAAVEAPDDGRERLVRIGLAEIDEGGLAARLERQMHARYLPADLRRLPNVRLGLLRRDNGRLARAAKKRRARYQQQDWDGQAAAFHHSLPRAVRWNLRCRNYLPGGKVSQPKERTSFLPEDYVAELAVCNL